MTAPCTIRQATAPDASSLLAMIRALADYEKLSPPTAEAEERLRRDAFGPHPCFEAWLAEVAGQAQPVGYTVLLRTYSTFLARPTLFIEDLFVLESWRGRGIGRSLLQQARRRAEDLGCGRMEWFCLDWNTRAQRSYEAMGARHLEPWWLYRLDLT